MGAHPWRLPLIAHSHCTGLDLGTGLGIGLGTMGLYFMLCTVDKDRDRERERGPKGSIPISLFPFPFLCPVPCSVNEPLDPPMLGVPQRGLSVPSQIYVV